MVIGSQSFHSDTGAYTVFSCRRQCNHFTTLSCTDHEDTLMLHGRRAPLAGLLVSRLGIADALGQDLGVLVGSVL